MPRTSDDALRCKGVISSGLQTLVALGCEGGERTLHLAHLQVATPWDSGKGKGGGKSLTLRFMLPTTMQSAAGLQMALTAHIAG